MVTSVSRLTMAVDVAATDADRRIDQGGDGDAQSDRRRGHRDIGGPCVRLCEPIPLVSDRHTLHLQTSPNVCPCGNLCGGRA